MTGDTVKIANDAFISKLADITRKLNFNILAYNEGNDVTLNIHKGNITVTDMPDNLVSYINDDKEYCSYFSHGDNLVVLYFLRFKIGGTKYVVVVQDNKKRTRLNKFVSALMNAVDIAPEDIKDNFEVAEREGVISLLELRVKELQQQVNDKESEISKLSLAIEQQEQDAILDMAVLSQEKGELEEKLRKMEENARDITVTEDSKGEVIELWDTAAREEVDDLRKALSDKTAELENIDAELKSVKEELALMAEQFETMKGILDAHQELAASKDEEIHSLRVELREWQDKEQIAVLGDSEIENELVDTKARLFESESECKRLAEQLAALKETTVPKIDNEEQQKNIILIESGKKALEEKLAQTQRELADLENSLLEKFKNSVPKDEHDAEIARLKEYVEELRKDKEEFSTRIGHSTVSIDKYNEAIEENEKWKKVRTKLIKEQEELKKVIEDMQEESRKMLDKYSELNKEIERRNREVNSKEKLIADLRQTMKDNLRQQNEMKRHTESLSDINEILRKNRDKLNELINGLSQPIITINEGFKVVLANKASLAFARLPGITEMAGQMCHQRMYNRDTRCVWCMVDRVRSTGEPTQVNVLLGEPGNERHLDVTFFPIFDVNHNLVEVAEFISDKTEMVEMAASISKFKDKMREFKKTRIEDMNEITEVKKAYQDLNAEHERVIDRNSKMLKVIERLVSEDKARELLNVRTELMEVRNKLYRSTEMIKNYKYQLDEQLIKYSDLNKRTFLQMERLLNIMKGKNQLRSEETVSVLSFLSREFEMVKKHFIQTEKSNVRALIDAKSKKPRPDTEDVDVGIDDQPDAVEQPVVHTEVVEKNQQFQSEEERMLHERFKNAGQGIAAAAMYAKSLLNKEQQ